MDAPVELDLPSPDLAVNGDPDQLTRLLVNLLENAARHTPRSGRIVVSARAKDGRVALRVEDTGEGIPPEHLPHVCERFWRADRSRASPGTGLGLAICRQIAEAHGGTLTARSEPGRGSVFTLCLPICDAPHAPSADQGTFRKQ